MGVGKKLAIIASLSQGCIVRLCPQLDCACLCCGTCHISLLFLVYMLASPSRLSASGELGTGIPRSSFNKWWLFNEWQPGDFNKNDNSTVSQNFWSHWKSSKMGFQYKGEKETRFQGVKKKSECWGKRRGRSGHGHLRFCVARKGRKEAAGPELLGPEASFMWPTVEPWLDWELRWLEGVG